MGLELSVKSNIKSVAEGFRKSAKQARFAAAGAINDVAFKTRLEMQEEMRKVFDRPSSYTLKSVYVTEKATRQKLSATVKPTYFGGKGVDPQNFLGPQVFGGARKLKKSEVALQRVGILPKGMFTVMPRVPNPEHLDEYGNYKGSFIRTLLSYFRALGEQGYKGNMSDKRRAKMHNEGRTEQGYKTINGVAYFVSRGRTRSLALGGYSPLALGIWAKSGIHGSNVRPVLLFVKAPRYRQRLDLDKVATKAIDTNFNAAFSTRFAKAMATAKP